MPLFAIKRGPGKATERRSQRPRHRGGSSGARERIELRPFDQGRVHAESTTAVYLWWNHPPHSKKCGITSIYGALNRQISKNRLPRSPFGVAHADPIFGILECADLGQLSCQVIHSDDLGGFAQMHPSVEFRSGFGSLRRQGPRSLSGLMPGS